MVKKITSNVKKNSAIILLVAVILQLINVPLIDEKTISLLLTAGVAIYLLIK